MNCVYTPEVAAGDGRGERPGVCVYVCVCMMCVCVCVCMCVCVWCVCVCVYGRVFERVQKTEVVRYSCSLIPRLRESLGMRLCEHFVCGKNCSTSSQA